MITYITAMILLIFFLSDPHKVRHTRHVLLILRKYTLYDLLPKGYYFYSVKINKYEYNPSLITILWDSC